MDRLGSTSSAKIGQTALDWRLALLCALTLALRLPGIDRPLTGNFATKNVVYAMVARNWAQGHAPLYQPTLDSLAGGGRALHLVEWPAPTALVAGLWRVFGGSLDVWGRAVSVAASVASVALVYVLARRWFGQTQAIWAGLLMAAAPVSVIYGRSFMLEVPLVSLLLGACYGMVRWWEGGRSMWLGLAIVLFALACLTKIYVVVAVVPLAWAICVGGSESNLARGRMTVLVAAAMATLPAVLWYAWSWQMSGGTEAERIFYGIRNSAHDQGDPWQLWLSPAWHRQVLGDLATVVLTPVGALLVLGAGLSRDLRKLLPAVLASVVLVLLLPRKFAEMNYYYVVVLPVLALWVGLGAEVLRTRGRLRSRAEWIVCGLLLLCSLRYSIGPIWRTPLEDRGVLAAAQYVRALTRDDEPIVTMHGSTLDLLYYTERVGWNVSPRDPQFAAQLAQCVQAGARWLVVAGIEQQHGTEEARTWLATLPCVRRGDDYALYRLEGEVALTPIGELGSVAQVEVPNIVGIVGGGDFDGDGLVELGVAGTTADEGDSAQSGNEIAQSRQESDGSHRGSGGDVVKQPHQRGVARADSPQANRQ